MESTENATNSTVIHSTSDLAKRLGLSRWTVSRVLNGHKGVHPETALRVHQAMRELGFSPNPLAQGLRSGKTHIVGVCLPDIEGLYLGRKLEYLRQSLATEGFHVMVGMTNGDSREEEETLGRFRVLRAAGVILVASRLATHSRPVRQFHEASIPLLLLDPMIPPPKGSLCVDRSSGMREAARHLFALGHRRLATLGLTGEGRYSRLRCKGLEDAYTEMGWDAKAWVQHIPLPAEGDSLYEASRRCATALWREAGKGKSTPRPTAILTLNDRVAIGLIDGLRQLGVRVPEDVSVIGYDNMELGAYLSPRLTSIDSQPDALIAQTTARLLRWIGQQSAIPEPTVTLPCRLVIRDSTGPCPKGQRIP